MLKIGFHIREQNIIRKRDSNGDSFGYQIFWVQKRISFLGIPLYVRNLKVFPSLSHAISFVLESSK